MKLKETVTPPTDEGIFAKLADTISYIDGEALDLEYYLGHSGEKTISPLYVSLLAQKEEGTIADEFTYLVKVIKNKYEDKWRRIYQALVNSSYNPIENYSMIEHEGVNTNVKNETKNTGSAYGFNSSDPQPVSDVDTETITSGTSDDNNRTLTRSGNIGVTTSQQMLESELTLRDKHIFSDILMKDVDEVLTIPYYD